MPRHHQLSLMNRQAENSLGLGCDWSVLRQPNTSWTESRQKVSDEATTPSYCKIQPSFTTYYIQHSHVIRWELGFDIVGEEAKVYGADEIVVLPPSDYRVPPEEQTAVEAAPPFEDGCESDRKLDRPNAPLDSSEE